MALNPHLCSSSFICLLASLLVVVFLFLARIFGVMIKEEIDHDSSIEKDDAIQKIRGLLKWASDSGLNGPLGRQILSETMGNEVR